MVTLTFAWNTFFDGKTCERCKNLHGHKWYFYDETPTVLLHPHYGVVWDLIADRSLAHGSYRKGGWNCRCRLTWEIDDSDLQEDLLEMRRKTRLLENRLTASTQFLESFIYILARAA